jgi:hypothetical protein
MKRVIVIMTIIIAETSVPAEIYASFKWCHSVFLKTRISIKPDVYLCLILTSVCWYILYKTIFFMIAYSFNINFQCINPLVRHK